MREGGVIDRDKANGELVAWIKERKIQAYEYGRQIASLPESNLKTYGYKTREEGLVNVFKVAEKMIEERIRAFEKRFPS